ncbi:hypothetical protein VZT92_015361 [Zoarces viviparus]|uniref:Uncharacterized protein n=1 Tax=Zoarces viviparus TaxID=48416 RepID=A0AAW1EW57_ZOAVI
MGSRGDGAKRSDGRGKRLLAWQLLKQQGLPHIMEVVHGLVSFSDWRARERRRGPKALPTEGPRPKQKSSTFKGEGPLVCALVGKFSQASQKRDDNLVSSLWVEVSYLTSVYVDVEGWVSAIRNYEQQ